MPSAETVYIPDITDRKFHCRLFSNERVVLDIVTCRKPEADGPVLWVWDNEGKIHIWGGSWACDEIPN